MYLVDGLNEQDLSPLDKYTNGGPFKSAISEPQGLDLSPVHTQVPDVKVVDLSPTHQKRPDFLGFDLSPIQRQSIEQEDQVWIICLLLWCIFWYFEDLSESYYHTCFLI